MPAPRKNDNPMRARLLVSCLIAAASGSACWFLMLRLHQHAGDLRWALHLAQQIVARQAPYDTPLEQYPLTAGFFALPLIRLPPEISAAIFWGISSGLLAFGITRRSYLGLLVFLAYPYWAGILAVQWSVAIAAGAFFWILLPFTMAKPQVGLPVFLSYFSKKGLVACAVVAAITIAAMPNWPLLWIHQRRFYEHFFPLLVLPGELVLLAFSRWRDRDARFLLFSALLPQRWFFDTFTLWLIPKSRREIVWTVFFSWGAGIWRWFYTPHSFTQVGRATVIFIYLPMLAVILLRRPQPGTPSTLTAQSQTDSGADNGK